MHKINLILGVMALMLGSCSLKTPTRNCVSNAECFKDEKECLRDEEIESKLAVKLVKNFDKLIFMRTSNTSTAYGFI